VARHFIERERVHACQWDAQANDWLPVPFSKKEDLDPIYGERLVRELREIVREPLPERSDPRSKKWNMQERFPQDWVHLQGQLHERLARRGQAGGQAAGLGLRLARPRAVCLRRNSS
jgi:hypothetical protein